MPTGSASGNYMDAYNFNRRYNEAELRKANAAAERQEQQTKYMADVTAGVKTNQNPTKPQESAFGAVKFTDEPGNNAGV